MYRENKIPTVWELENWQSIVKENKALEIIRPGDINGARV